MIWNISRPEGVGETAGGGGAENLKPFQFKPGQSGNPGGRPKTKFLSEALRTALESGDAEAIAQALLKKARKGDVAAIREVADRTEGKAPQAADTRNPHREVDFGDLPMPVAPKPRNIN